MCKAGFCENTFHEFSKLNMNTLKVHVLKNGIVFRSYEKQVDAIVFFNKKMWNRESFK